MNEFLSKTDAGRLRENNQQKFINFLKLRSNKNDLEYKKWGWNEFEDSMDLLVLIVDDQSHYVYIKDLDRFMFH